MHRYIPYLAKIAGFHKIGEKVVKHQARKYGTTKFGLDRFVNGYLDLITLLVYFQIRKETDALLRFMGKRYVLHWFYRSSNRTQHEIDLDVLWRSKTFDLQVPLISIFH